MSRLEFHGRLRYPSGFTLDATFVADSLATALCGPSGSGKTSVLSAIAGLRRLDAGRIVVNGRVLFDSSQRVNLPAHHRRVGYVFQDHLLFPHLDVRHNLLYGWKRRPAGARDLGFDRVAAVLELGDLLPRAPHTLSGGQRQRVALGRAVLAAPELLLMDEPLNSLELELKDRVLTYLERVIAEWQIPVLYVTHDLAEAARLTSQTVKLADGRVEGA